MDIIQQPLRFVPGETRFGQRYVWDVPIRLTHWVTAFSVITLFATGMFISWPIVGPGTGEPANHFLMGRVRQVHFASAYALMFSFIVRGYWFIVGGRYARSGMPRFWDRRWWNGLRIQILEYMSVETGPAHVGHNALAGVSYVVMVGGLGMFQILTGFALYSQSNPGGFWDSLLGWVIPLCGGSFHTQMLHHLASWGFVIFFILHIYIVLFGAARYKNGLAGAMISGEKFFREGDLDL